MKRLKIFIIGLVLLIPCLVKADAGGPIFSEYNVRVSNKNGTDLVYFDYQNNNKEVVKKHLNYDDVVLGIIYEDVINGENYGYSNNSDGYVKLKDVIAFGDIDFDKLKENGYKPGKLYVYKKGAYLYKGPSKVYGKVEGEIELPVGTTIEYTYRDDLFAYVTYNNVSGWVYIYQPLSVEVSGPYKEGSSTANIEYGKLITIEDTVIYDDPVNNELVGTIPKDITLNYKYIYDYGLINKYYYVEYKGISGWVKNVAIYEKNRTIFTNLNEITICKDRVLEKCSNPLGTIPKLQIIDVKYTSPGFDRWFYVEYNGISGWVYSDSYESSIEVSYKVKYLLKKSVNYYTDIYGDITDKILEPKEIITDYVLWDNNDTSSDMRWVYVNDGNEKGWIKVNSNDLEYINYIEEHFDLEELSNNNTIPFKEILIYTLGGAAILSLTTFVTIKLINKKKDKVND